MTKYIAICEFWVSLHELLRNIVCWNYREQYYLLLFDIVSSHFCIFAFVWSEQRHQNIVCICLVTKKSTFVHALDREVELDKSEESSFRLWSSNTRYTLSKTKESCHVYPQMIHHHQSNCQDPNNWLYISSWFWSSPILF